MAPLFPGRIESMKLKDRVAIVTGAGRNIGEAVCKELASEGAKIVALDMDKGRGDNVVQMVKGMGGQAISAVADISSEADVKRAVGEAVKAFGRIDILVNNAAISDNKTILDITKEQWDKCIAVTLTGPFLMSKYVVEQMVKQGQGGNILNIASTSGYRGRPRAIAYTTAKAGVVNFSRSLAMQVAKHNIRVNCLAPNKIGSPVGKDEFDPTRPINNLLKRSGLPEDLAKVVSFMVSDDSRFIVAEDIFVDGGNMAMENS
jgi:NAD(P)-dependent dehydrogenase (short-subunit alcohol dehydrogenase family)